MIIKKLSLLLTLLVFFNIGYSQNWEQVTSGNSNSLNASFFISHKKGWVVGNQGTILKTEDSGMSWSVQESGSTAKLYDIYFVDYNNGYAVGGCATVLKTMNGGDSWELVRENCSGGEFFSIVMKDNNTGIAVGTSNIGTFYTNDGFDTDIGGSDLGVYANKLQKVQFTNRIFTCTNSSIKVSDDYGLSWQNIKNHNAILGNLKFGHYLHPNAIYVANSSKVFRSSDTQENWSVILDPADGFSQMQSIFFLNELKGYVVSTYGAETTIRVTRDGGKTFSTELTDYFSAIRDINFYNDSTGLAVGDNGSILKYDMTDTIYNAIYEDTVIYNTSYKDTVVYNVTYSDSVIYDTTRVEVYDTLYFRHCHWNHLRTASNRY